VEIGNLQAGHAMAGAEWRGDRMLLSVDREYVRFVAGNILYRQDRVDFFQAELPSEGVSPRRASWLQCLSTYETPFFLRLAKELVEFWPGTVAACDFLPRFGHFYYCHRSRIELAARESRTIAEALLALQHWPVLLEQVMNAMGEPAFESLPKGLSDGDLGGFLGRLLIGAQSGRITLVRIPECLRAICEPSAPQAEECLRIPHYRRMLEKLGPAAESAALLIEGLLAAL